MGSVTSEICPEPTHPGLIVTGDQSSMRNVRVASTRLVAALLTGSTSGGGGSGGGGLNQRRGARPAEGVAANGGPAGHFCERLRFSSSWTLIWPSSPVSSERACRSVRGRRRRFDSSAGRSCSPEAGPASGRAAAGVASALIPRSIGDGPLLRRLRDDGVEVSGLTEAARGRRPVSSRAGRRPSGERWPVGSGVGRAVPGFGRPPVSGTRGGADGGVTVGRSPFPG